MSDQHREVYARVRVVREVISEVVVRMPVSELDEAVREGYANVPTFGPVTRWDEVSGDSPYTTMNRWLQGHEDRLPMFQAEPISDRIRMMSVEDFGEPGR